MKTLSIAIGATFLIAPARAQESAPADSPLAELLRESLFAEEAERDLAKAEAGYREILRQFDAERAYAATAVLRLAEIRRGRGEMDEAEQMFARVLREFSDQEAVAEVARARLGDKAELVAGGGETMSKLQAMLEQSPDLLNVAVNGATPLERAAADGDRELVEYLLGRGADVSGGQFQYRKVSQGELLTCPLGRAVAGAHLEVVGRLLEAGAEPIDGVLHTASSTGNLAITKVLLNAGANPNTQFGTAAIMRDPVFPKQGQGAGRSVSLPPPSSADEKPLAFYTPLEVAALKGFTEVCKLLLASGAVPDGEGLHGQAMHAAVTKGNAELVRALLEKGFPIDGEWDGVVRGDGGQSLLHLAARGGSAEIVDLLLAAGADIGGKNERGATPLHEATGGAVGALLTAGADPNARDQIGMTPLMDLSGSNGGAKAKALAAAGADVNAVSGEPSGNYSPLLMAAERGALDAVKALVEAGADATYSSKHGNALHHVPWRRPGLPVPTEELIRFLVEAGTPIDGVNEEGNTPLVNRVAGLAVEDVALLLELGANPDGAGEGAWAPLAALPAAGHPHKGSVVDTHPERFDQVVRLLADAGADLDALDSEGRTALYKAATLERVESAELLLARGASAIAGVRPAYEALVNRRTPEPSDLYLTLFRTAQTQAPDRARRLRCIGAEYGRPFVDYDAGSAEGPPLPPCPYGLVEVFAFSGVYVPQLGSVRIWRLDEEQPIEADLAERWRTGAPEGDVALQWGDVVEFLPAAAGPDPVSDEVRKRLDALLTRTVNFQWRSAEGEESPEIEVTVFPRWEQAKTGRGWVLGGANAASVGEGISEVAVLPTLGRVEWVKEGIPVHTKRVIVRRGGGEAGGMHEFVIEMGTRSEPESSPIPVDGDSVVIEGALKRVGQPVQRPSSAAGRRAVVPRSPRR